MKTTDAVEPRVQDLLREATEWRLLGLLFERPREDWWREVTSLCREVSDPDLRAATDAAKEEADEGLYLALLGPGGAVSPREVAYRAMEDPGHILAEIMAFYEAFAFQPASEEPPDHLAVEAGFLGYLCLKQAYARLRGSTDDAEIAAQAASRFCEEHLSRLAWSLADRLAKTEVQYLAIAARALTRRTGPRRDTEVRVKAPARSCDDCPMECGQE